MKKLIIAAAATVLLGAVASAQTSSTNQLALRLGLNFPIDSVTKAAHQQIFGFGGQHWLKDMGEQDGKYVSSALSIDYYARGNFRHIPIMYNVITYMEDSKIFYSIGAGMGFVRQPGGGGTESVARIAYGASLGINLSTGQNATFLEAKFFGSGSSKLNAAGIFLGFKF
jgi:hypothetical protein